MFCELNQLFAQIYEIKQYFYFQFTELCLLNENKVFDVLFLSKSKLFTNSMLLFSKNIVAKDVV